MTTPTAPSSASTDAVVALLGRGVEAVVELDVDVLDDHGIAQVLAADERAIRRLQAHQARLADTLARRRAAQARAERPDDARAPARAARQVRDQMTEELGITPARAKQVARTGQQVRSLPATASAHAAGDLTDQHVAVIAEVTAHLAGPERQSFEAELVEVAGRCRDAVEFGRQARRMLIDRDHDAAQANLDRTKMQRAGRVSQTPDGRTVLRLEAAGYAGELIHTVVDAFRTHDADGEHRTAEQRTHDAIVTAFEVALRSGRAATQHGVRPHVAIVVPADAVRDGRGTADTSWTGPLPYAEVAALLGGDCSLTRVIVDARDVPLSVSHRVRTVPAGLWQALCIRDTQCIVEGCDAPAAWCQVAHLGTPYRDDGKLTPDTAGLLCTAGVNHHAVFDRGGGTITWTAGRPVVRLSTRRPAPRPGPPRAPRAPHPDSATPQQLRVVHEARAVYRAGAPPSDRGGGLPPPVGVGWGGTGRRRAARWDSGTAPCGGAYRRRGPGGVP